MLLRVTLQEMPFTFCGVTLFGQYIVIVVATDKNKQIKQTFFINL